MRSQNDILMDTISSHPDLHITLDIDEEPFIAGGEISGDLILDCQAEPATLALGDLVIQLVGTQDLRIPAESRIEHLEHFTSKYVFQGPSLPPSHAVDPDEYMELDDLPDHFYPAKQGETRFSFRIDLPPWLPGSIDFQDTAVVSYELRAIVAFYEPSELKCLVQSQPVGILEAQRFPKQKPSGQLNDGGLHFNVVCADELVANTENKIFVEVENGSRRTVSSLAVTFYHHLIAAAEEDSLPYESVRELCHQRFERPELRVHPEERAKISQSIKVPNFAWGSSGYQQDAVEGLFKVQTLMTVSLGMEGIPDTRLILPVHLVHPAAAASGQRYAPYSKSQPLRVVKRQESGEITKPPPKLSSHRKLRPTISTKSPHLRSAGSTPVRTGSGGSEDTLHTPTSDVVSPTPMRTRSGSFVGLGPYSEEVRHLEEVVKHGYTVERASPFRAPIETSEEESMRSQAKTAAQIKVGIKAPPLSKRLVLRYPPPPAQYIFRKRTPMPLTSPSDPGPRPPMPHRPSLDSPVVADDDDDDDDDEDVVVYQPAQKVMLNGGHNKLAFEVDEEGLC